MAVAARTIAWCCAGIVAVGAILVTWSSVAETLRGERAESSDDEDGSGVRGPGARGSRAIPRARQRASPDATGSAQPRAREQQREALSGALVAERTVVVRVTRADGSAATDAAVWCDTATPPIPILPQAERDGSYRIALSPCAHRVFAKAADTATATASFALAADEEEFEVALALPPGRTLRGRVVDEKGEAVAGVPVRYWREDGVWDEAEVRGKKVVLGCGRAATGAAGEFEFTGLDPSPVRVHLELAEDGGFEVEAGTAAAVRPGGAEVVLRVRRRREVVGRVLEFVERTPIPRFTVDGQVFAAADARFRAVLAPGRTSVRIAARGYVTADTDVGAAGRAVDLGDVLLHRDPRLGAVDVEIVDPDDEPADGLRVVVLEGTLSQSEVEAPTVSGKVGVEGLLPGSARVVVDTPGWSVGGEHVEVTAGVRSRVRLVVGREGGVVTVTTRGHRSRTRAVTSARVVTAGGTPAWFRWNGDVRDHVPWLESSGRLSGLAPGSYVLQVSSPDDDGETRTSTHAFVVPETGEADLELR